MPRPKPNPETVIPRIIDAAVRIIQRDGFERLTMRAVAADCAMSVGKLYHFFASKDALFLTLEIHYFEGLLQALQSPVSSSDEQRFNALALNVDSKRVEHAVGFHALLSRYFAYANANFALYQLVSMPPKVFSHYVGTPIEATAREELFAAMAVIDCVRNAFLSLQAPRHLSNARLDQEFLFVVNSMHGLIMMSASAAWPYISRHLPDGEGVTGSADASGLAEDVEQQIALLLQKTMG